MSTNPLTSEQVVLLSSAAGTGNDKPQDAWLRLVEQVGLDRALACLVNFVQDGFFYSEPQEGEGE